MTRRALGDTKPVIASVRAVALLLAAVAIGLVAAQPAAAAPTRVELETVPGYIYDVSPDRILYGTEHLGTGNVLKVRDRDTGAEQTVPTAPAKIASFGFLTSHGVLYWGEGTTGALSARLYEWRDGQLLDLGFPHSAGALEVEGDYATYVGSPSVAAPNLYLRDLETGVSTEIDASTPTHRVGNTNNDLTADGEVVWWAMETDIIGGSERYRIYRWRDGAVQPLTDDPPGPIVSYPLTDGVNVAYRKTSGCCAGSLGLFTSSAQDVLGSARDSEPIQRADYAVAGGWFAYTRVGAAGQLEVWTRSPEGQHQRRSPEGDVSYHIIGLNPAGDVMFREREDGAHLYLARAGRPIADFGPAPVFTALTSHQRPGTGNFIVWRDGQWLESDGGTLSALDPDGSPPDQTPPSLTVPRKVVTNATSHAGAVVGYGASAVDDVDPSPELRCAPASGTRFPIGKTTVTCTASDDAGNRTTKSFHVVVRVPEQRRDCKHGGWRAYGSLFRSQGACVAFVARAALSDCVARHGTRNFWALLGCVARRLQD